MDLKMYKLQGRASRPPLRHPAIIPIQLTLLSRKIGLFALLRQDDEKVYQYCFLRTLPALIKP